MSDPLNNLGSEITKIANVIDAANEMAEALGSLIKLGHSSSCHKSNPYAQGWACNCGHDKAREALGNYVAMIS